MKFIEDEFKEVVRPQILRCRDGDWNHCQRVVKWVKELGRGKKDLPLLITAAYIHDIGWRDILPPGRISFDELLKFEEQANKNSKPYVATFLKEVDYSDEEISTVSRLIKAADAHRSELEDEAVIVDADSMSKLSINHLKEKFKKSEWMKMYNLWEREFPNRIKTERGKHLYPELLAELKRAIQKELIQA